MPTYLTNALNPKSTPQSQPIPGREAEMTLNNAGGYTFKLDDMKAVERFLILGSEGGTYYVNEQKLTLDNLQRVMAALRHDGPAVVRMAMDISLAGRAPKNDPALMVLAMAASPKYADANTNQYALTLGLPCIARTGYHLLTFANLIESNKLRGWGRLLRSAVANWFINKRRDNLAYQLVKYQSRNGWSMRDLLRLTHAKSAAHNPEFHWAVKGEAIDGVAHIIEGFEKAKALDKTAPVSQMVRLISDYGLTREMIPTEWLAQAAVWEALLQTMPLTAMIRNLGKMTQIGLIRPMSDASRIVTARLRDREYLKKSRIHPVTALVAKLTYQQGKGVKGSLTWNPLSTVADALEDAFYAAFEFAPKTGKRFYLGLDVSGSMGTRMSNLPMLDCRTAAAAMAMVTMRSEDQYIVRGFSDGLGRSIQTWGTFRSNTCMSELGFTAKSSLNEVVAQMTDVPFGGTDCSLPMLDALKNKIPVDAFVIYTDNETWFDPNKIHPAQALRKYREEMGIDAKLIVVGMTATEFTINDPKDPNGLDVAGFDTTVPQLISSFVGGESVAADSEDE